MDFRESLEFLYGLQRFGIKLGTENTRMLLERAGVPQQNFLCVHIAGTNGKGSTAAFLAAILQEAGFRVGLYTSPHLQSFCERIRINGLSISEEEVAEIADQLRSLSGTLPVTFFEVTTVMALCAFAKHQVEIAVIETGMGGRLDATNAIDAEISIITPISFDHQQHLGQTLRDIAFEKAGIIKEGRPVISGFQPPEAMEVLRRQAEDRHAPLLTLGNEFHYEMQDSGSFTFELRGGDSIERLHSPLPGTHQPQNASAAIMAALTLRHHNLTISDDHIRQGLLKVYWPGRLEWWGKERNILLDGAHNPAGARVLADYLRTLKQPVIHWLVGIKDDKDYVVLLKEILPLTSRLYALPLSEVASIDPQELVLAAQEAQITGEAFLSVDEALKSAKSHCQDGEMILVAGSLYLVGAVRERLCHGEGDR